MNIQFTPDQLAQLNQNLAKKLESIKGENTIAELAKHILFRIEGGQVVAADMHEKQRKHLWCWGGEHVAARTDEATAAAMRRTIDTAKKTNAASGGLVEQVLMQQLFERVTVPPDTSVADFPKLLDTHLFIRTLDVSHWKNFQLDAVNTAIRNLPYLHEVIWPADYQHNMKELALPVYTSQNALTYLPKQFPSLTTLDVSKCRNLSADRLNVIVHDLHNLERVILSDDQKKMLQTVPPHAPPESIIEIAKTTSMRFDCSNWQHPFARLVQLWMQHPEWGNSATDLERVFHCCSILRANKPISEPDRDLIMRSVSCFHDEEMRFFRSLIHTRSENTSIIGLLALNAKKISLREYFMHYAASPSIAMNSRFLVLIPKCTDDLRNSFDRLQAVNDLYMNGTDGFYNIMNIVSPDEAQTIDFLCNAFEKNSYKQRLGLCLLITGTLSLERFFAVYHDGKTEITSLQTQLADSSRKLSHRGIEIQRDLSTVKTIDALGNNEKMVRPAEIFRINDDVARACVYFAAHWKNPVAKRVLGLKLLSIGAITITEYFRQYAGNAREGATLLLDAIEQMPGENKPFFFHVYRFVVHAEHVDTDSMQKLIAESSPEELAIYQNLLDIVRKNSATCRLELHLLGQNQITLRHFLSRYPDIYLRDMYQAVAGQKNMDELADAINYIKNFFDAKNVNSLAELNIREILGLLHLVHVPQFADMVLGYFESVAGNPKHPEHYIICCILERYNEIAGTLPQALGETFQNVELLLIACKIERQHQIAHNVNRIGRSMLPLKPLPPVRVGRPIRILGTAHPKIVTVIRRAASGSGSFKICYLAAAYIRGQFQRTAYLTNSKEITNDAVWEWEKKIYAALGYHPCIAKTLHMSWHQTRSNLTRRFDILQYYYQPLHRAMKSLTAEDKKNVIVSTIVGLAAAHSHSIVFGDIKTGNTMVIEVAPGKHMAVYTDFGLAHPVDAHGIPSGRRSSRPYAYGSIFCAPPEGFACYCLCHKTASAAQKTTARAYLRDACGMNVADGTIPQLDQRKSEVWALGVELLELINPNYPLRDLTRLASHIMRHDNENVSVQDCEAACRHLGVFADYREKRIKELEAEIKKSPDDQLKKLELLVLQHCLQPNPSDRATAESLQEKIAGIFGVAHGANIIDSGLAILTHVIGNYPMCQRRW